MTLEYKLIELAKLNADKSSEHKMVYRIAIIKEMCSILKSKGYNINRMHFTDIKGRHINALMHYWLVNNINKTVLSQKYLVLTWWCNIANNANIIRPIFNYSIPTEFTCSNNNLDHILLPTSYCFECDIHTEFVYNKYKCPICNASIGVHLNSNEPLGGLANFSLKQDRKLAHTFFDPMWERKLAQTPNLTKSQARRMGYKWLSIQLNIPQKLCHIAFFDSYLCEKVVVLCKAYYKK